MQQIRHMKEMTIKVKSGRVCLIFNVDSVHVVTHGRLSNLSLGPYPSQNTQALHAQGK